MPELVTVDRHVDPQQTRLAVRGEVDVAGGGAVRGAMEQAALDRAPRVELDLEAVTFLDSSGLAAILHGARTLDRNEVELVTSSPRGSEARLVIEMAGVARLLGLGDERPHAASA